MIERCHKYVKEMMYTSQRSATESARENKEEEMKIPYLVLPYMGEKGDKIAQMPKKRFLGIFSPNYIQRN